MPATPAAPDHQAQTFTHIFKALVAAPAMQGLTTHRQLMDRMLAGASASSRSSHDSDESDDDGSAPMLRRYVNGTHMEQQDKPEQVGRVLGCVAEAAVWLCASCFLGMRLALKEWIN
jgi:hypothetical protein